MKLDHSDPGPEMAAAQVAADDLTIALAMAVVVGVVAEDEGAVEVAGNVSDRWPPGQI